MHNQTLFLYEGKKNATFKLMELPNINLLESLGVRPGTVVTILNIYKFGGPVLLRIGGNYTVALGKDIAKKIKVEKV